MKDPQWIIPAGSIVLGLGFLLAAIRRQPPLASLGTANGRVVRATVRADDGHFRPDVAYDYVVDGVSYRGDTIHLGGDLGFTLKSPASSAAGRYTVGEDVKVYFDPADPKVSCLVPDGRKRRLFFLVAGVLALAIGLSSLGWF
ncbi:hypothetical protein ABI59_07985 [Acidobacteria bacterium Mor1]|nr:hypothetical protein ABI59_07985 [Acidobacteria bacterium Mor1]